MDRTIATHATGNDEENILMKKESVNNERRKFFTQAGAGIIGGMLLGSVAGPLKKIVKPESKRKTGKVNISINTMAVKRTNKG
jgi:hypothetical protein